MVSDRVSPPRIMPNETDVTAMLNENVRLMCMATEPIYWRFHVCAKHFNFILLKFTAVEC